MLAVSDGEHITAVVQSSWVNSAISLGGVFLTALVSWLIYWHSTRRSARMHKEELERLRGESKSAEIRHEQQIQTMLVQGRQEREVRLLRDLSDCLVALARSVGTSRNSPDEQTLLKLEQYSLKIYADFAEDDEEFASSISDYLIDLVNRSELNQSAISQNGDKWLTDDIKSRAKQGAILLLRWSDPNARPIISEMFANYSEHGVFE